MKTASLADKTAEILDHSRGINQDCTFSSKIVFLGVMAQANGLLLSADYVLAMLCVRGWLTSSEDQRQLMIESATKGFNLMQFV